MKKLKISNELERSGLENDKCPICKGDAKRDLNISGDFAFFVCYRCGVFRMSGSLHSQCEKSSERDVILSSFIRELYENSNEPFIDLNTYNYESKKEMAHSRIPEFSEKLNISLKCIQSLQEYPGEYIPYYNNSLIKKYLEALTYSKNEKELEFILQSLREIEYLKFSTLEEITISPYGYKALEDYKKRDISKLRKAFIAIKFGDEKYEKIASVIKEVVKETGFKPIKVDEEHHTDYIMDFIISQIKESRFLIAELTSKNQGVYYEMGYAMGIGIPVIALLYKEGDEDPFSKVHFDLKQFNTIVYENEEDLKEKLTNRIKALF